MYITPEVIDTAAIAIFYDQVGLTPPYPMWEDADSVEKAKCRRDAFLVLSASASSIAAEAWDQGVKTTLNHAIENEDGMTLRLEHLDGRPWINPYLEGTS